MKRVIRNVMVMLLVAAAACTALAASKDRAVDFSGTWKLNVKKSKGFPDWRPDTVLVVLQSPYQVHFTYFLNADAVSPFQNVDYVTNGLESKLYATGPEEAYASAKWSARNVLLIRTHHVVRSEIADTDWTEIDTWTISDDGKTLTNKQSDGRVLVYEKSQKDKMY
jgi:hypothetical protein